MSRGLAPTFRVARRTLTRNWARSLRLILLISIPAFAGTVAAIVAQTNAAAAALEEAVFTQFFALSQHCYNVAQTLWVTQWTRAHGTPPSDAELNLLFWRHHAHERLACDAKFQDFGGHYMAATPHSAAPLVVLAVVGLVAVVLFSLAAFAANTRNMRIDLGLIAVVGATPDQARYTVALQGLIIGILGTLVGMGAALIGALAFPRTVASLLGVGPRVNPVISPLTFLAAFITLAATLVAAWLPARSVGRTPPLETLRGEARRAAMRPHFPKLATATLVIGISLVGVGMAARHFGWFEPPAQSAVSSASWGSASESRLTNWFQNNWFQNMGVTLFVGIGLALTLIGCAGVLPQLLARIAALGPHFPVGVQLALRDIARSRHRTVPVATMVLVATAFGAWLLLIITESTPTYDTARYALPQFVYLIDVVAFVVAVVLMAAGLATALTVRDADGDFRILGALGAPPQLHRALTAAQSAIVASVGTILGIAFGIALGVSTVTSQTSGAHIQMPWVAMLGLAIAAPAAAALVTWMITRPESPKKTANWYSGSPIFRS